MGDGSVAFDWPTVATWFDVNVRAGQNDLCGFLCAV
jgi:hypothetical protein